MQKLIIIDTFGFFFRSFYALPPLQNSQGFPTGLLTGFANLIMKLYKSNPQDYIVFALEGGGQNIRKHIYKDYKANRQETPQELLLQLPVAIEWIEKMQLVKIAKEGYEADDVIASLAHLAKVKGIQTQIISHDKDLYQLIDDDVFLLDPVRQVEIRQEQCQQKFGVLPHLFIDYQSLVGDTSDNVPGIKGIGAKTACKLLEHFGSLDAMYARENELEEVISKRLAQAIREQKSSALLSRKLVTLVKDLPLDVDFQVLAMPEKNPLHLIIDELSRYEFTKIVQRLSGEPMNVKHEVTLKPKSLESTSTTFTYKAHTLWNLEQIQALLTPLPKDTKIAYDCESTGLDTRKAELVGFSFCFDGKNAYYVPVAHTYLGAPSQLSLADTKAALELLFSYPLIGHNLKYDLQIAKKLGIEPKREIYDSMILAWLYDSASKVGLDEQMRKWFSYTMLPFSEVLGSKQNFAEVLIESATEYAAEDAAACFALFHIISTTLESKGLQQLSILAQSLEFPFIQVLVAMEDNGISIDTKYFQALSTRFSKDLLALEQEIFTLCNDVFNLNSPKQLGTMLFDKLGLKAQRQIKGGYSTDEKTLQALLDAHPVIPKILEYREASKLKNTYVEPLLKHNDTGRIYTSFLQSGTATGRLSSKNPNLQNIPVRSEQGRLIRAGFRAKSEDYTLLSIDYSQIELRLLAHFSQDSALVEAFCNHLDIHLQTASILFSPKQAQEKRHIAKSINFGLIYGMGARKLAQTLGISFNEAKSYIQSYFDFFPSVKTFLKSKEQEILHNGYAQTLLGHRRHFDFSNATDFMRANYLREGVNTIFQGSAADLIKMAMLKIHAHIQGSNIAMLLQVHDELIFELPKQNALESAKEITYIMDNIYPLAIPLESSVSLGDSWADLK
ncbi:DNA polymerase I [Helicobacter sp.]|uniref:DNA polymerase I n=1 Tax=Helicobacter sp. TaxID=218 RepID=UPI0025BE11CB|nr:DNA polymerase I [Helicobacter sp.]MBR2494061.1 DNA polymerase I [Helicobacter sp.]